MSEIEHVESEDVFIDQFSALRPDLFFPTEWTDEQREVAVELARPAAVVHSMYASIPLLCRGQECDFAETCPYVEKNIPPVGKPCPIEMNMVHEFGNSLMREWGVDPANLVEVSFIRTFVNQEVKLLRASKKLSLESFIQENVVGLDAENNVVTKKELHLAIPFEESAHKQQDRIIKAMLASREARVKAGEGKLDPMQTVSNILDALREKELENARLLRAQQGEEYRDEYLDAIDAEVVEGFEEKE